MPLPDLITKWQMLVRVVWFFYATALFLMTHLPVPAPLENMVSTFDKAIHAAAFYVLAMLTLLAFPGKTARKTPSLVLLSALLGYAALDEYLQGFVNRTPDVMDWISDSTGILLAWLTLWGVMAWTQTDDHDPQNQNPDHRCDLAQQ